MSPTSEWDEALRLAVYDHLARTGTAPDSLALSEALGVTADEVDRGMRRLADARHLVLDDHGAVVLAHPFATQDFGFSVMGRSTLWWGGCAWDAFAIPAVVSDADPALVATTCPACDSAHAWVVGRSEPPEGEQLAHFLVPMSNAWDDVIRTCSHQRIFCGEACIADWLAVTSNERGTVFDLATLWRLARHWYDGRLDHGYERREPAEARAYFASAGLCGSFWGLD